MTAMSWREERDALIAQTLAFVQSVTGKPAEFAELGTPAEPVIAPPASRPSAGVPSAGEPSSSQPPDHLEGAVDAAGYEVMRAEAAMIDAAMQLVASNRRTTSPAAPTSAPRSEISPESTTASTRQSPTASDQATVSGELDGQAAEFSGEHFTSITSELGLQRDMQSEIRARVATFRAHQERFNRERQEYFSSTLAKLRASMTAPDSDKG
jgi:hypothetical protein